MLSAGCKIENYSIKVGVGVADLQFVLIQLKALEGSRFH